MKQLLLIIFFQFNPYNGLNLDELASSSLGDVKVAFVKYISIKIIMEKIVREYFRRGKTLDTYNLSSPPTI